MLHRIREAFPDQPQFSSPVEVDEIYIGGKRRNMSNSKRNNLKDTSRGRGVVGKKAVMARKVQAQVVAKTDKETLHAFVNDVIENPAIFYTDEHKEYNGIPQHHETVCHSVSEYVRDQAP